MSSELYCTSPIKSTLMCMCYLRPLKINSLSAPRTELLPCQGCQSPEVGSQLFSGVAEGFRFSLHLKGHPGISSLMEGTRYYSELTRLTLCGGASNESSGKPFFIIKKHISWDSEQDVQRTQFTWFIMGRF